MEGAEGELIELFVTEWPQSIDYCCSKAERKEEWHEGFGEATQ